MKNQTKSNLRAFAFAAVVAVVFMFAANSSAFAQTNYKVGDRVEVMLAAKWHKAKIVEAKNGEYKIDFDADHLSDLWYTTEYMRPEKADAPTGNQNNAGNQAQNQRNENAQPTTVSGAAAQDKKSLGEIYGSREPRTCEDTKAPAKGAITAALAQKYFICQAEQVSGNHLYLIENVKLEVGGGIPYDRNLGAFEAINVRVPLYPIRGSLLRYQCKNPAIDSVVAPDKNCNAYNESKATGYCYKTTFGDWRCFMADISNNKENFRSGVAPPQP